MATLTKTHTDDAWIGATRLRHTDDALIAKNALKKTHTDDAYLKKQRTHTDDAIIAEARGTFRGIGLQADRDALVTPVAGDTYMVMDDPNGRHHHFYTGSYWMPAKFHQAAEQGTPRNFSAPTATAGVRSEQGDLVFPIRLWDGSQVFFSLDQLGNLYANSEVWGSASSLDAADTITLPENPLAVTPSRRQNHSATGNSAAVAWSPATAAGNLLVFVSWAFSASVSPTVTTPPTGYTLAVDTGASSGSGTKGRLVIYYKANSAGGDANPSITWAGAGLTVVSATEEVVGVVTGSPLDKTATNSAIELVVSGSGIVTTGTTPTTTKASEWAVGAIGGDIGTPGSPDSGFSVVMSANHMIVADRSLSAKGAVGFSATFPGSAAYAGAIATFKVAAGSNIATPASGFGSYYVAAKAGTANPYFMDDAGVVHDLAPASVQHGASLTKSATQILATSTPTAISFGGEDFDTDNFHDVVTNNSRFTIPAGLAGIYIMGGQVDIGASAAGNVRNARIDLNGVGATILATAGGTPITAGNIAKANVVRTYFLNVGDFVELVGNQDSGGNLSAQTTCTFWIARL